MNYGQQSAHRRSVSAATAAARERERALIATPGPRVT